MDLGRPRAPAKERFDLAAVARDVVTLAERQGRGNEIAVRFEGLESALVDADPAQLRQVAWNLVRNATQASTAGDEVVVRLSEDPDGAVTLSISDQGAGIQEEARERLFDAYFTTRSHGVGVGLAVVKRIIDDHGFAIEVDSKVGERTTFRVRVPPSSVAGRPRETTRASGEAAAASAP